MPGKEKRLTHPRLVNKLKEGGHIQGSSEETVTILIASSVNIVEEIRTVVGLIHAGGQVEVLIHDLSPEARVTIHNAAEAMRRGLHVVITDPMARDTYRFTKPDNTNTVH